MKFFVKFTVFSICVFLSTVIYAQDSNNVNYSLFLEKSVAFGTVDTKIDEGSFKEGQSFVIPAAELPSSPIDFSIYQDLYNAIVGGRFGIDYGALNNDVIMKIFIRRLKPAEGTYLDLGTNSDTLFSYFEIRVWELPDSNFYPEDSSFYFNKGFYAEFSLPKSENLIKFLNITGIGTEDSLGFAFLESKTEDSKKVEDWVSDGIETFETADSIMFKSIHLSRIGGGRRKRITTKTVTGINANEINNIPDNYKLFQNYPNPFNPTTTIRYSIPEIMKTSFNSSVSVHIKVYDVLGKQIATLVEQKQKAGMYEVEWNASKVPSGIYFYTLQANGLTLTQKMIVLK